MPASIRAGDVLAGRYRMVDLLSETEGGWFWCAHDDVLQRQVAVHLIRSGDSREEALEYLEAEFYNINVPKGRPANGSPMMHSSNRGIRDFPRRLLRDQEVKA